MNPLPRAVLFDWDKTLVDNWAVIGRALNATLSAYGLAPWTPEEVHARVKRSLRDSFPELFGESWREAERVFRDHFNAHHIEGLTVIPGAPDLLEHLAGRGVAIGVVSNKHGVVLRKEADHLGWTRLFHKVVGAGDAEADKPDPRVIALALEGSGIAPGADVWYVGDSAIDLECAHRAACVPVLVGPGPADPAYPPRHAVGDLAALRALLDARRRA